MLPGRAATAALKQKPVFQGGDTGITQGSRLIWKRRIEIKAF